MSHSFIPSIVSVIPSELFFATVSGVGFLLVVVFLSYLVTITVLFRNPPKMLPGNPELFEWHVVVPCLNEESVLTETLTQLVGFVDRGVPLTIWVVDDASTDRTRAIVSEFGTKFDAVRLIGRNLPDAQTGKSGALNAAYQTISVWSANIWSDPNMVIVGVVDADGHLDPETFNVLAGDFCFGDSTVGAVQQDVWMRDVHNTKSLVQLTGFKRRIGGVLVRLQDLEFRASIAAIQNARHRTKSVCMGGNGQWTRLGALDGLGKETGCPWKGSLLEDFELGIHLLMDGWVTRFTAGCWVSQEAVPELRRLLKQRVRWCQGSMQCLKYGTQLWRSSKVSQSAMIEMSWYLLQPWAFIVATFVYPVVYLRLGAAFLESPSGFVGWVTGGGWFFLGLMLLTGVAPLAFWGTTYRKRCVQVEGGVMSYRSAIFLGLAYVAYVHLSYVVAWRALFRVLLRKNGWVKTARNVQGGTS